MSAPKSPKTWKATDPDHIPRNHDVLILSFRHPTNAAQNAALEKHLGPEVWSLAPCLMNVIHRVPLGEYAVSVGRPASADSFVALMRATLPRSCFVYPIDGDILTLRKPTDLRTRRPPRPKRVPRGPTNLADLRPKDHVLVDEGVDGGWVPGVVRRIYKPAPRGPRRADVWIPRNPDATWGGGFTISKLVSKLRAPLGEAPPQPSAPSAPEAKPAEPVQLIALDGACETIETPSGPMFFCTSGTWCSVCGDERAALLCDAVPDLAWRAPHPSEGGELVEATCDVPLCPACAHSFADGSDYCPKHEHMGRGERRALSLAADGDER